MSLQPVSLVLLVVLSSLVCSEDQLGSILTKSLVSDTPRPLLQAAASHSWTKRPKHNFTAWDEDTRVEAGTDSPHKRLRRYVLASDGHPLDYEFFRGVGYYKYHTKPQIWEQARRICESEGAHLMIVNSDKEIRVIRAFLERKLPTPGSSFTTVWHMGFSDHETEGLFVTVLGEPLSDSNYINWWPGQPDNTPVGNIDLDSDCGAIHVNLYLDDVGCSYVLPFWCEMPL